MAGAISASAGLSYTGLRGRAGASSGAARNAVTRRKREGGDEGRPIFQP
jgi:hypothetical protein